MVHREGAAEYRKADGQKRDNHTKSRFQGLESGRKKKQFNNFCKLQQLG